MWPFNLSVRLPIVALVGRYLTNQLIGREAISKRIAPFPSVPCETVGLCGISSRFQLLSPSLRQVPHALLTRSPLNIFLLQIFRSFFFCMCWFTKRPKSVLRTDWRFPQTSKKLEVEKYSVRLACVRRAASVRPEPGSNSLENDIYHFEKC